MSGRLLILLKQKQHKGKVKMAFYSTPGPFKMCYSNNVKHSALS